MTFTGTIFFDFEGKDSWRLFVLLGKAQREGVAVDVEWKGFVGGKLGDAAAMTPGQRALAAHAAVAEPDRQRRMREALFTLVHKERDSLEDELTYRAAARVAGVDGDVLLDAITEVGFRTFTQQSSAASAAGVVVTPSIVRNGPPLHVVTTPAIDEGRARLRVDLIDRMLADDGMWGLAKP